MRPSTRLCVVLAAVTIYWNGTALSLPPSLIANAASLRPQRRPAMLKDGNIATVSAADDRADGAERAVAPAGGAAADVAPNSLDLNGSWRKDTASYMYGPIASNERTTNGRGDGGGGYLVPTDLRHTPQRLAGKNELAGGGGTARGALEIAPLQVPQPAPVTQQQHQQKQQSWSDDEEEESARAAIKTDGLDINRQLANEYELNALLARADGAGPGADRGAGVAVDAIGEVGTGSGNRPDDATQSMDLLLREVSPRIRAVKASKSYTPLKYWARQCQINNNNCLQEYYSALFSGRNKAATPKHLHESLLANTDKTGAAGGFDDAAAGADDNGDYDDVVGDDVIAANDDYHEDDVGMSGDGITSPDRIDDNDAADDVTIDNDDYDRQDLNNDVLMLINGEQDVIKFLYWAMELLYPYQKFTNLSENDAEYYHPGMYIWKKLNSSGRLEPPLLVDEPHYIIVRREKLQENQWGSKYNDDPFIPPRGRKHDVPNLDALMHRYETFVPNRGRRDKITDIFKYDDLFYPNRGKKHMLSTLQRTAAAAKAPPHDNMLQNDRSMTTLQPPSPLALMAWRRLMGKLKGDYYQTHQNYMQPLEKNKNTRTSNEFYEMDNRMGSGDGGDADGDGGGGGAVVEWPEGGMAISKINGHNQSVKPSALTAQQAVTRATSATPATPAIPATSTRSAQAIDDQQRSQQLLRQILSKQWQSEFINDRYRKSTAAIGDARAALANRLHSMKSMSTGGQQYQRHQQQQQQHQQRYQRQGQHRLSSPAYRVAEQQYEAKSFNKLDPSVWRHLQLLKKRQQQLRRQLQQREQQQKDLTPRYSEMSPQQHLPQEQYQYQQQHRAQSPETQLAAIPDDFADDINQYYLSI